jgi:DNA-binding MarR family transcriptional regulator
MTEVNLDELSVKDSRLYSRVLLSRARDLMLDIRQTELAPYDISPRQAYVLFILYHLGHKATLAQLAKHNEREANTISVQMTRMEREGLVKKVRQTTKSTLLMFEMTKKGIDVYHQSKKHTSEKVIMSVLSEEERQQFVATLQKIIHKAEKYRRNQLLSKN